MGLCASMCTGGSQEEQKPPQITLSVPLPQEFKYEALVDATNNFDQSTVLGEGGFGKVYKAVIPGANGGEANGNGGKAKGEGGATASAAVGQSVAIKVLNSSGKKSGYREWVTEVLMLERLSHPNLVSLRGYCAHGEMAFLIYEYVSKGALNYHLFSTADDVIPLSWQQRLQIAVGAATGLHHLHERNIIHRDFKSANILLDDELRAKVSDFGLAKVGPVGDQSYVETKVKGTPGYIDPAYMERGACMSPDGEVRCVRIWGGAARATDRAACHRQ
ncbi:hypothetical protein CLOM_g14859 [Closterium sp. NIES-68]|nr:hypothetical protein CLOM_g14859 [Closterium sp. NIES-68]GJP62008.1 hypothetical protein CLOP_g19114 [Closterium sp. NIES-67]